LRCESRQAGAEDEPRFPATAASVARLAGSRPCIAGARRRRSRRQADTATKRPKTA
jgi:hypothetical protein